MSITWRDLTPEDYAVAQEKLGASMPDPESSRIIVAIDEENGEIVSFGAAVQVLHLEPIWTAERYRGTSLPFQTWNKMLDLLDQFHVKAAFSFSDRPEISGYLKRLGLKKLPYETFLYTKDEELKCQFPS